MDTKKMTILFDLDGTLARSEDNTALGHAMTASNFGTKKVLPDLYKQVMGKSRQEVAEFFMNAADCKCTFNEYNEKFISTMKHLVETQDIVLEKGAQEILEATSKIATLGLVTSSSRRMMKETLNTTSIQHFFQVLVSADDVNFTKPHPEPYLSAHEQLGHPDNVFVIEDTETGVMSAKNAGFITLAVRHSFNKQQNFSAADQEFQNLDEVKKYFEEKIDS